MTEIALVGGILLLSLFAGFVPFLSVELALIAAAATHRPISLLLVLAAAAAAGQMVGKTCFFLGGRSAFAWSARRSRPARMRLPQLVNRATNHPPVAAATVFVSAATGVPPFAVVSPLAGRWRLRLSSFVVIGLAGKSARFTGILLVPGVLSALHA